jgi:hypothetical protein
MNLCVYVSEGGGDGEGTDSETSSLLSYTLRYVSLTELGTLFQFGLREPMIFNSRFESRVKKKFFYYESRKKELKTKHMNVTRREVSECDR